MLDKQAIFNTVTKHLLTQKSVSANQCLDDPNDTDCCYRTDDGMKCALGCLIKDELYAPEIEGSIPSQNLENRVNILLAQSIGVDVRDICSNIEFFIKLQNIHDQKPVQEWKGYLLDFANTNGLNSYVVNQF